ncbi:uncharacterized protein LOC113563192 [Ooceraea biroi]|uniref:uncharacterized protein LOC113563192 n=1 Tax=Ooceraea biroi TaxID=2015173 RepID=UPI0005BC1332|nr:uncharacterized protein LOC113563192 [Ooceraea biroi]
MDSYGWTPFVIIYLSLLPITELNRVKSESDEKIPVALYMKWLVGYVDVLPKEGKKMLQEKSLFTAHTEKMFNNWRDNGIAERGINEFSKKSRICELHFEKNDILREDIFHMADGATITVQRKVPKLKEDAVPSIFPSITYRYESY